MEYMPGMSQKEYLKKYLQKDPDKKAKKKKKKHLAISSSTHLKRSVVIDDDVNSNDLPVDEDGELDLDQLGDEAPQVVGIIDERPEIVKLEEKYKSGKWRPLTEDGGHTESKMGGDKRTYFEANEDGRRQRDDGKKSDDSDLSPPRVNPKRVPDGKRRDSAATKSNKRAADGSDSDVDVPRRRRMSDSKSPAPKGTNRHREEPDRKRRGRGSDSDTSPPRRDRKDGSRSDRTRDRPRKGSDSDTEVARKRPDRGSDSDQSPARHSRKSDSQRDKKSKKKSDSRGASRWDDSRRDDSANGRGSSSRRREDSELSPPRRGNNRGAEPRNRRERRSSDSSPPRRQKAVHEADFSSPRRRKSGHESDLSPPRRQKDGNDSDLSPPRKSRDKEDKRGRPEKADKMGDGKKAGLQDAKSLKDELRLLKEKEDEMFRKMDPELLGAQSTAVVRDRKTGLKRDFEKEREIEREKAAKAAVRQRKYEKWGKGLKQIQEQEEKVANMIHEMSKPLARYAGDDDLERALKAQEREGDPMLEYIKRHQKDSHTIDLTVGGVRKKYMGSFPPNRFGISPGHRWDGVDRSNGYEQKWFAAKNAKQATAEEAWKWSSADM